MSVQLKLGSISSQACFIFEGKAHIWNLAGLLGERNKEVLRNHTETFKISALKQHKSLPLDFHLPKQVIRGGWEDGGEIRGSRVHFPSTPVKYLADLRSRAKSQQYSSIYEDRRSKIEDIKR